MPDEVRYLWNWYLNVITGPEPFTYTELKAWSELTCHQLEPWEVDCLRNLDRIRQKVARDE